MDRARTWAIVLAAAAALACGGSGAAGAPDVPGTDDGAPGDLPGADTGEDPGPRDLPGGDGPAPDGAVADTAGDASIDTAATDPGPGDPGCGLALSHEAPESVPLGNVELTALSLDATACTLSWRRALPGEAFAEVPMTMGDVHWLGTIPGDTLTFAGIDWTIAARDGTCTAASPADAPASWHHARVHGEAAVTRTDDVYDYRPAVYGHIVVFAKEAEDGEDDLYLFDLRTFQERLLVSGPKSQGNPALDGDRVAWEDRRAAGDEYDPNTDLWMMDLPDGTPRQVTTDPDAQSQPVLRGRFLAWRDDRAAEGGGKGDVTLFDLGPDGRFGTADDVGEVPVVVHPAEQTAPTLWAPADGPAVLAWADFRDDADGKCDAACDWNVYALGTGPDGRFGTADDAGPVRLTTDPLEQHSPAALQGRVAWLDARKGNWLKPEIWIYDLGPDGVPGTADDRGEARLPVEADEPGDLDGFGDRLVWNDFRHGNWEVFLYDFAASAERRVTDHPRGQFYPRVWRDVVVWQDARFNDPEGEPFDDVRVRVLP